MAISTNVANDLHTLSRKSYESATYCASVMREVPGHDKKKIARHILRTINLFFAYDSLAIEIEKSSHKKVVSHG